MMGVVLTFGNGTWCTAAMKTDSASTPGHEKMHNFFYHLQQLHDDYSSEGMLRVLKSNLDVSWLKILFLGRDGASVMKKLEKLLIEQVNPFLIGVWCANHCCQLLLKDIFKEVDEFWDLIDMLDEIYKFFHHSPKSSSQLKHFMKENKKGLRRFKRAKNLTRWTAVKAASGAVFTLLPKALKLFTKIVEKKIKGFFENCCMSKC
jgi:hypothetical protein